MATKTRPYDVLMRLPGEKGELMKVGIAWPGKTLESKRKKLELKVYALPVASAEVLELLVLAPEEQSE